jgi:hypothetical protein
MIRLKRYNTEKSLDLEKYLEPGTCLWDKQVTKASRSSFT